MQSFVILKENRADGLQRIVDHLKDYCHTHGVVFVHGRGKTAWTNVIKNKTFIKVCKNQGRTSKTGRVEREGYQAGQNPVAEESMQKAQEAAVAARRKAGLEK